MSIDLIVRIVGRQFAWRLGRRLYMAARGEAPNDMHRNGEVALARACVAAWATAYPSQPFVAFDVGANLGHWSAALIDAAGKAGCPLTLHVFEPVPGAHARLATRFAANPGVRLHQLALSSRSGTAPMHIVGETAGTNSLVAGTDPGATQIEVQLATVADMQAQLGIDRIDLLKIDTEGHDFEIVKSLLPQLRDGAIGVVQFEYNWRWLPGGASLRAVFELIHGTAYRVGRLVGDGIELFDRWNAEADRYFEANYVLVRADRLAQLPHRDGHWDDSNVLVFAR